MNMSMQLTKPEDLSDDNLLAVLDLAIEIQEQSELSTEDELRVPVSKSVMRYENERQATSLHRRPMAIHGRRLRKFGHIIGAAALEQQMGMTRRHISVAGQNALAVLRLLYRDPA